MASEHDQFAELFEAYLDGTLPESLRADIERQIAASPELQAEVELARQIDASLARSFRAPDDIPLTTQPSAKKDSPAVVRPSFWRTRRGLGTLMAAACVGWLLFAWQLWPDGKKTVSFEPQPLAMLYHQAVQTGFEPYWECPPERFRGTLLERQQAPLEMAEMPEDREMLGLAYPGGLSRDTTAMLCRVRGEPVMVFIDRVENDQPQPDLSSWPGTTIFRKVMGPLVLYEVSQLGKPEMLDYLVLKRPS